MSKKKQPVLPLDTVKKPKRPSKEVLAMNAYSMIIAQMIQKGFLHPLMAARMTNSIDIAYTNLLRANHYTVKVAPLPPPPPPVPEIPAEVPANG